MLKLAGIAEESIVDGPGLRFSIFTQGCPHHCPYCHNPQTHSFKSGKKVKISEIYQKIIKNPIIKGVTFSGGEPLCQVKSLTKLATILKNDGYNLIVYTGFTYENLINHKNIKNFFQFIDYLIDGRYDYTLKTMDLKFRGSSNQRVIDIQKSIKNKEIILHEF